MAGENQAAAAVAAPVQPAASPEQRLSAFLGGNPAVKAAPEPKAERAQPAPVEPQQEEQQPAEAADTGTDAPANDDGLSPDDLQDEQAPSPDQQAATDDFEIVHDGRQHKLSREKVIELAQKGFDYTTKTMAVAEQNKAARAILEQAQLIAQVQPILANEMAQVQALGTQLQQWQGVDWVKLATDDPLEYPKYRAQYDRIQQGYQFATAQLQQRAQLVGEARQNIQGGILQQEMQKLSETMPEFRDPAKYQKASEFIKQYAAKEGYSPEEVGSISDARHVRTLWKAAQYDRLLSQKKAAVGQVRDAPPMGKPGARDGTTPQAQAFKRDRDALRKSGSVDDAARLFARAYKGK